MKPYLVGQTLPQFNCVIYSEPGVGKTQLASTCQDHEDLRDILFVNIDGGLLTVSHRGDIRAVDIGGLDDEGNRIDIIQDLEQVLVDVRGGKEGYKGIKTICIDSGSDLQAANLLDITTAAHKKDPNKRTGGVDDIWQEDYGRSTAALRRVLRMYRDAPVNVVITALSATKYPPNQGKNSTPRPTAIYPSFTAKLADSVQGYADHVWYLYIDEKTGERRMLTQPQSITKAKTRGLLAEALGQVVSNPNLAEIYETLKQLYTKKGKKQ